MARPVGQLMRYRGVVAFRVWECRVVRHLDKVVGHAVERADAAVPDVGAGPLNEGIEFEPALRDRGGSGIQQMI